MPIFCPSYIDSLDKRAISQFCKKCGDYQDGLIAESDQVDEDPFVRADIEEITGTNYTDPADEGYDIPGQIEGVESPAEIIAAFCPTISAKTINRYAYLRLTITEEPIITENMGTPISAHNAGGVPA